MIFLNNKQKLKLNLTYINKTIIIHIKVRCFNE